MNKIRFQCVDLLFVVIALCCLNSIKVALAQQRIRYDHYQVYQLKPEDNQQMMFLQKLDGISREAFIFLDELSLVNSNVNVLVSPQNVTRFLQMVQNAGISHRLMDDNAQLSLEDISVEADRFDSEYNWRVYHTLNSTYNWLYKLAKQSPDIVSVFNVGQSYEGRDILGLKISYGDGRRAVFVEGGIHAREWISPATVTFITQQLLTSNNTEVRSVAENYDWFIVPHANPDGYVYTHTTDRIWRKTRTPYGKGCFGADPNRNWNFHWNEVGASGTPCSDTYAGPQPFSEVETRALADFIKTLKDKIELYLSFHSYSQLLLFPYGHTAMLPENFKDLTRVFNAAVAGMQRRYGTKYSGGNVYKAIYPAAGSSIDWAYGVQGIKYAYCYELRPQRNSFWNGFKLPAAQIIPTGKETLDSVVAMIQEIGIKRQLRYRTHTHIT